MGLLPSCGVRASRCSGFSHCRAQAPGPRIITSWGSRAQSLWPPAPEHRLSSCGTAYEMSSSQIRDRTCVSCTGRWIFTSEPLGRPWYIINVTENRVWLLAAQKLIKRQNLWKGKSTSEANSRRGESTGWSGVQD